MPYSARYYSRGMASGSVVEGWPCTEGVQGWPGTQCVQGSPARSHCLTENAVRQ